MKLGENHYLIKIIFTKFHKDWTKQDERLKNKRQDMRDGQTCFYGNTMLDYRVF